MHPSFALVVVVKSREGTGMQYFCTFGLCFMYETLHMHLSFALVVVVKSREGTGMHCFYTFGLCMGPRMHPSFALVVVVKSRRAPLLWDDG